MTEPVPELLAGIGWTGGEAIVDARMFLHYFRTTNDGRVLMGSGSGPIGRGNRIDQRFTHDAATAGRAELGLRRLLPDLADAKVERAWGGAIDVSADTRDLGDSDVLVGGVGGAFSFRSHRRGPPERMRYAAIAAAYPESMLTAETPLAQELTAESREASPWKAAP